MEKVEIMACLISFGSLIALLYQVINLRCTIKNQIYESFISNSVEIDKLLVQYPDLRKYVYDNECVSDKTDNLDQIMSIVEMIIDVIENIEVYKKYIPKERRNGWMQFVKDVQNTSAYKYYMSRYGEWFKVE